MFNVLNPLIPLLQWIEQFILILLFILGVSTLAIFIWKWRQLLRQGSAEELDSLKEKITQAVVSQQPLASTPDSIQTIAHRVLSLFHGNSKVLPAVLEKLFEAQESAEKRELERGLSFLGTVGSNAPFLGLTGTVIGILAAFNQFALSGGQGSTEVMVAISRALIATALGLIVAIPAVVFYNILRNKVKLILAAVRELRTILIAHQMEMISNRKQSENG